MALEEEPDAAPHGGDSAGRRFNANTEERPGWEPGCTGGTGKQDWDLSEMAQGG